MQLNPFRVFLAFFLLRISHLSYISLLLVPDHVQSVCVHGALHELHARFFLSPKGVFALPCEYRWIGVSLYPARHDALRAVDILHVRDAPHVETRPRRGCIKKVLRLAAGLVTGFAQPPHVHACPGRDGELVERLGVADQAVPIEDLGRVSMQFAGRRIELIQSRVELKLYFFQFCGLLGGYFAACWWLLLGSGIVARCLCHGVAVDICGQGFLLRRDRIIVCSDTFSRRFGRGNIARCLCHGVAVDICGQGFLLRRDRSIVCSDTFSRRFGRGNIARCRRRFCGFFPTVATSRWPPGAHRRFGCGIITGYPCRSVTVDTCG